MEGRRSGLRGIYAGEAVEQSVGQVPAHRLHVRHKATAWASPKQTRGRG